MNSLHYSIPPTHPVMDEHELQQAVCLLLYTSYHRECINGIILDTNYQSFVEFCNVLSSVFSSCAMIVPYYIDLNALGQMDAVQIMDYLKPKMGAFPMPPSLNSTNNFMKEIPSIGLVLEKIVSDWITLRNAFGNTCSTQISQLRDVVIDILRSLYNEFPENKYTRELLDFIEKSGFPVTEEIRYFIQGTIVATQIQANCISMGYFGLIVLTQNTQPCFIFKQLLTEFQFYYPNASREFYVTLQKHFYTIYDYFKTDITYPICNAQYAINNPEFVIKAARRAFTALYSLLSPTQIFKHYENLIAQSKLMLDTAVPAVKENVMKCLPNPPANIIDVYNTYEMISNERLFFCGEPNNIIIARWGYSLYALIKYLSETNKKGSDLYSQIDTLCKQILKMSFVC